MNKKYVKYIAIVVGVIIVAVGIYNTFTNGTIKYDFVNPQPLQLEEQEFDTSSQDVKVKVKDDGYISEIDADDNYIYYLCKPSVNDPIEKFSEELAYIRKMDRHTGTVQTLHEFSGMGRFSIHNVVYNQDYCFVSLYTFDNMNESDNRVTLLKISKETGDSEVIYQRSTEEYGWYDVTVISNDFTENYLIWREFDSYDKNGREVREYKLYHIQKNEVTPYKYKETNYEEFCANPTIHQNKIVYNIVDGNGDSTIMSKALSSGVNQEIKIHDLSFYTGFYNDNYLAWRSYTRPSEDYIAYDYFLGDVYLFDFNTEKPFLVDEQATDFRVYNDYIVTVKNKYVSLIDYRNNKKSKYVIEETEERTQKYVQVSPPQRLVTVTDNFIIMEDNMDKSDYSIIVTYKKIVK